MSAFRAVVLEHFRRPKNRGALDGATAAADGANPLCGDRIRIELRVVDGMIDAAGFVADACALCIASASVLTEHVRGTRLDDVDAIDADWIHAALQGDPPPGRAKCVLLPLTTLRRAAAAARSIAP